MTGAPRLDVRSGTVPDYSTFVRHIWQYEDADSGSVMMSPPWVYSALLEDPAEVEVVFTVMNSLVTAQSSRCPTPIIDPVRIAVMTCKAEDGLGDAYDVAFADLQALHVFLLMLAAQSSVDAIARQAGEFLMWTLGFRWV